MTTNDNDYLVKTSTNFSCDICNYNTTRKYNLDVHLKSIKHKNRLLTTKNNESLVEISKTYKCQNCSKEFNDRAGLWRHKKKCNNKEDKNIELDEQQNESVELIKYLMKENSEFKQMIIEQNKQMIEMSKHAGIYTNNTTNSHNKSFNLQLFLNETCKDAMNIMDFVDSLKIQLSDLENVGELGYVDGISNIIIKNLNLLDETKRPVHCTDTKREVLYVKDENKWEKENDEKSKMRKVIKHVTHKNSKLLKEFKQKYPGCEKSESKYSGKYDKLIIESMGGKGDNDIEKEDKIIKNISKRITIDKNM